MYFKNFIYLSSCNSNRYRYRNQYRNRDRFPYLNLNPNPNLTLILNLTLTPHKKSHDTVFNAKNAFQINPACLCRKISG